MTVVVDHDRGRVIWMHQGHGQKVFDLFFQALTPARRESIRAGAGDGGAVGRRVRVPLVPHGRAHLLRFPHRLLGHRRARQGP